LATCGVASRRACEQLIVEGRVDVNGVTVTQLGVRIDPDTDEVRLDGERLRPAVQTCVLVLNKPVGYLSAASDPEGRPLVYHLIPRDQALRSIGRLDFNTEGVLLFTNDGALAERLGHARYSVQRVYEARVRGIPGEETLARLRMGVRLEDGPARAEQVEVVKATDKNAWVRLTLTEGRNREVRRLLERVGHPVVRLRRVSFAGITAAGLGLGQWRLLDDKAIHQLRSRGHVGAFELPPDPRKKSSKPVGLSTGPGPKVRDARRGAGRTQRAQDAASDKAAPPPSGPRRPRGAADRPPKAGGKTSRNSATSNAPRGPVRTGRGRAAAALPPPPPRRGGRRPPARTR
jgi:23S rRNA pseudouridine2605 synthase